MVRQVSLCVALFILWLAVSAIPVNAGVVTVSFHLSDFPQSFVIPDGEVLDIQFLDVRLLVQGDVRIFKDSDHTQLDDLIRFINVDGLERIYYDTDPSTIDTLPPLLNPDFVNDFTGTADYGTSFVGAAPVFDLSNDTFDLLQCSTGRCGLGEECFVIEVLPEPPTLLLAGIILFGMGASAVRKQASAQLD